MINHIVSFSAGAASFKVLADLCEEHGPENVLAAFTDTLIEDEDLYRFLFEAVQKLGCWFYYMCDGRTPWQVFREKRYFGNTRTAHCSDELKRNLFREIIERDFPPHPERFLYFGFDWKEVHRHERAVKNWEPYNVVSPLTKPPFYSRAQVFQVFDDYDIEVPRLYRIGMTHNNCGGMCPKGGQAHYAQLLKEAPEAYQYAEQMQEQLIAEIPTMRPFLRVTIDKKLHYLTLKEFRNRLNSGCSYDLYDRGGCGCFSDD